jgi:DNA-binding Lrp family transcriptional regulator
MGQHKNPWALNVIQRICDCGRALGYVTAVNEKRITRGWVDVCWIWKAPLLPHPLYLLVVEIETSKSDWPRIRNNAAKAVALRPLIYAHIFKPGIRLTPQEKEQLAEIHHGRHVMILDDNSSLGDFLVRLKKTGRRIFSGKFLAFCLIRMKRAALSKVEKDIATCRGIVDVYPVFGTYDFVAILSVDEARDLNLTVRELHSLPGIESTSTVLAFKRDF